MENSEPEINFVDIKPLFQNRNFVIPSSHLDKYEYNEIVDFLCPGEDWNLSMYKLDIVQKMVFITFIKPYADQDNS